MSTNAETKRDWAVEALEAGKLTPYEAEFVEQIRNWTKKQLRGLTSKQYALLTTCADKA